MQQLVKTKEANLTLLLQVEEDGAGDGGRGEGEGAGHRGAQDQEDTAHDCIKVRTTINVNSPIIFLPEHKV